MKNEIIIYQPNELTKIEVKIDDDMLWLTQAQIVHLFASSKANVSEHIKHIFQSGELVESSTVRKFRTIQKEGNRNVEREQLKQDAEKFNKQYGNLTLHKFDKAHDRFLIIDSNEVYHIGASLKDLGKKWFAFTKMEKSSVKIMDHLKLKVDI